MTVAGRLPMNDAIDIVDCASERPCASVSTTAKSFASRTSTENDVRMNAVDGFVDHADEALPLDFERDRVELGFASLAALRHFRTP